MIEFTLKVLQKEKNMAQFENLGELVKIPIFVG